MSTKIQYVIFIGEGGQELGPGEPSLPFTF